MITSGGELLTALHRLYQRIFSNSRPSGSARERSLIFIMPESLTPKQLRERASLTQRQVADALSLRSSTVSEWERGLSYPNLTFYETLKLLNLYNCSLEELSIAFDRVTENDIDRLRIDKGA